MENNIEFALAIDTLNKKIAELNIKIAKDLSNVVLKNELEILLRDKEKTPSFLPFLLRIAGGEANAKAFEAHPDISALREQSISFRQRG